MPDVKSLRRFAKAGKQKPATEDEAGHPGEAAPAGDGGEDRHATPEEIAELVARAVETAKEPPPGITALVAGIDEDDPETPDGCDPHIWEAALQSVPADTADYLTVVAVVYTELGGQLPEAGADEDEQPAAGDEDIEADEDGEQ